MGRHVTLVGRIAGVDSHPLTFILKVKETFSVQFFAVIRVEVHLSPPRTMRM